MWDELEWDGFPWASGLCESVWIGVVLMKCRQTKIIKSKWTREKPVFCSLILFLLRLALQKGKNKKKRI